MVAEQRQSAVFIDLDHTLLEGPFESLVFPRVLGEISQKTGLAFDTLLRQARRENLERMSNPAYTAVQAMDWDDIFTQVAARLGVTLQVNACELVEAHPGSPGAHLHPGAREALEQLASGKPRRALVAATKGLRKYQLPVLTALGLAPFFDDLLTPDSNQALKQSLAFYGAWPQMTRVQIMVGDTYEDDVLPARRFGFKTVFVNRKDAPVGVTDEGQDTLAGQAVRPDVTIASLFELPEVINRLERGTRPA